MRRSLMVVVVAVTAVLTSQALAVSVDQVNNPRHQDSWVTDQAGMLSEQSQQRIDDKIDRLERETGVEIAVVTVDTVAAATPRNFATKLFNHWGIGKAGEDNGLLILMVESDRRLEMETGYGLEPVLSDGWQKEMQQEVMIPHFQQGDFDTGLVDGVEATAERIHRYEEYIGSGTPVETSSRLPDGMTWVDVIIIVVVGLVVLFAIIGFSLIWREERTCPDCKIRMRRKRIKVWTDVPYLTRGQEAEHALKSRRHKVYECPECDQNHVISSNRFFDNKYSNCEGCGYRTATNEFEVIDSAMESANTEEKMVRRSVTCHNEDCGYESESIERAVAAASSERLRRRSTGRSFGGGGGSGSFGGGSSGGGGAGSSW